LIAAMARWAMYDCGEDARAVTQNRAARLKKNGLGGSRKCADALFHSGELH
jgi:hypothetical protein